MLKNILIGGIDLPKLDAKVSSLKLALAKKYEETNAALADHIGKANELIASRALGADVETLRMKLDRLEGEMGNCSFGEFGSEDFPRRGVSGAVAEVFERNVRLEATIATLSKQVEALTAAKLSEVKARKAPKK